MIEIPRKCAGDPLSRAPDPHCVHAMGARSGPLAPSSGWGSRGYLPHFDAVGAMQHIVFRLSDALPAATMAQMQGKVPAQRFAAVTEALRAGHGARLLLGPGIAGIVESALLHFDAQRYRLIARDADACPRSCRANEGRSLSKIVRMWRSFTAHKANKALGRTGLFWAREYYDHFMRDAVQLETTRTYIDYNPVAAGSTPEQWRLLAAWA